MRARATDSQELEPCPRGSCLGPHARAWGGWVTLGLGLPWAVQWVESRARQVTCLEKLLSAGLLVGVGVCVWQLCPCKLHTRAREQGCAHQQIPVRRMLACVAVGCSRVSGSQPRGCCMYMLALKSPGCGKGVGWAAMQVPRQPPPSPEHLRPELMASASTAPILAAEGVKVQMLGLV